LESGFVAVHKGARTHEHAKGGRRVCRPFP
jgi:hypothetical protein